MEEDSDESSAKYTDLQDLSNGTEFSTFTLKIVPELFFF